MDVQKKLDEIYDYIWKCNFNRSIGKINNHKKKQCIKVFELIDNLQNEIDNLNK